MRIDPNELQSILSSDKSKVQQQANACQTQIDAVYEVIKSDTDTKGAAYDSARDYLSQVKLPALQCQVIFLDALMSDINADIEALSSFEGEVLDSSELETKISMYDQLICNLEEKLRGTVDKGPTFACSLEQLISLYRTAQNRLQQKLQILNSYTSNSSIYSNSCQEVSRLKEATNALGQVSYSASTNIYDLSQVTNGSWNSDEMQSKYWKSVIDLFLNNKNALPSIRAYILNELKGTNDSTLFGGDPVNLSTGNFIHQRNFLTMGGLFPLSFSLFYNSLDEGEKILGKGWSQNFGLRIQQHVSGMVSLRMADGHEALFFPEGKEYVGATAEGVLAHHKDEGWEYTDNLLTRFLFDSRGVLIQISDAGGCSAHLSYTKEALLESVISISGERLNFFYENNLLVKVSDSAERAIQLDHKENLLVALTNELGYTQRYEYDDFGRMSSLTNHNAKITLRNKYDDQGRVKQQSFANGSTISYQFDESGHKLTLIDQEDHKTVYESDGLYRTVACERIDGTERFEYDRRNLRTCHISRQGYKTCFLHDTAGRISSIINAENQSLAFERNETGRPLEIRLGDKVLVHNTFDEHGHLTSREDALGRMVELSYDKTGKPIKLVQPDGSTILLTRDSHGNVTHIKSDFGISVKYKYDELGRVVSQINADGGVTRYEYDACGNIICVTDALGNSRRYRYDACGNMIEMTDYDGLVLKRSYDEFGLLRTATDKMGGICIFEYDALWRLTKITDQLGASTTYTYDQFGRLESTTNALGESVHYKYDADDKCIQVTYPNGSKAHFVYDRLGRVMEIIDCSGAVTRFSYNRFGKVNRITDPAGNTRLAEYDNAGQLISLTDETAAKTVFDYDAMGHVAAITNPYGMKSSYEYFPGGLLARFLDAHGIERSYAYDICGRLAKVHQDKDISWSLTYDLLGRIKAVQGSDGWSRKYEYDALGECSSLRDANGNLTRYKRNGFGELAQTVDALGNSTEFNYDARGNLIDIIQSDGKNLARQTHYERDLLGRITKIINPLGQETSYSYNELGHLASILDAEDFMTTYSYTPTGSLQDISYADGRKVDFSYDILSRLSTVKDWLGTTSIERDAAGRIVSTEDPLGSIVRYERGAAGELTGLVYPDGKRVSYKYDNFGRLIQLATQCKSVSYEYDRMSRLVRKSTSDGLETCYNHDIYGHMKTMAYHDTAGELIRLDFDYDAEGNRVRRSIRRRNLPESGGDFTYAYDALNRLINVSCDGNLLRSYSYDAYGNRIWEESSEAHITYSYDAADRLLCVTRDDQTTKFSYDARGNLHTISRDTCDLASYEYDATNRLVQAIDHEIGHVAEYAYSGFGQRISQNLSDQNNPTNIQATRYVRDLTRVGRNLLQKYDEAGCESLLWDSSPVAVFSNSKTKWLACDDLGSPLEALSSEGISLGSIAYDEFGRITSGNQLAFSGIGFASYGQDPILGLLFAEAREYNPHIGRFVAHDQHAGLGEFPQTLNKYTYCWNSPLDYIDVNGLWPQWQDVYNALEFGTEQFFNGIKAAWNALPQPVTQFLSDAGTFALNGGRQICELDFKSIATVSALSVAPFSLPLAGQIYLTGSLPSFFGINDFSDVAAAFTKSPLGEKALDLVSFSRDEDGIYHAKQECWQAPFGYNDFYDYIFRGVTSAQPNRFDFVVGDTEHTLWLWKGDYYNLGAGAESGIYRGNGFHKQSATDTNLYMKLNLYDKDGKVIFIYDPKQNNWWTTGFNPNVQDAHQEDLIAFGSVDFSANPELWEAFYQKYCARYGWCFDEKNKVAYYAWQ